MGQLKDWIANTPALISASKILNMSMDEFTLWLPKSLIKSGAAKLEGETLVDLA
jgi:hypothetical protein